MTHKFEYRYKDHDDHWEVFKGNACDIKEVATQATEFYWNKCGKGDPTDFALIVEVRSADTPIKIDTFKVEGCWVEFFASLQIEETK